MTVPFKVVETSIFSFFLWLAIGMKSWDDWDDYLAEPLYDNLQDIKNEDTNEDSEDVQEAEDSGEECNKECEEKENKLAGIAGFYDDF